MKKNTSPSSKSHVRKVGLFSLIVVALVVIASSLFVLFNPNGIETASEDQDGTVHIGKSSVTPVELHIKKGENVTWTNDKKTPHRLVLTTANPPKELEGFGSDEAIGQDETYSFTFDVAGSFTYEDPDDPQHIKGTIVVE